MLETWFFIKSSPRVGIPASRNIKSGKILDLSKATFSKMRASSKCPFFNMEQQFIDQNVRKVLTTVQF